MEPLSKRKSGKKEYAIIFLENQRGCGKRMEFEANSYAEIIEILNADHAKRDVEIFVDGSFECRASHCADGIRFLTDGQTYRSQNGPAQTGRTLVPRHRSAIDRNKRNESTDSVPKHGEEISFRSAEPARAQKPQEPSATRGARVPFQHREVQNALQNGRRGNDL